MAREFNYDQENISYNPLLDYCTLSPDVILGVKINYGCYLHDRHYRNERKVRLSRKEADQLLRDHIYTRLIESDETFILRFTNKKLKINIALIRSDRAFFKNIRRKLAYLVSGTYYLVVRTLGGFLWQNT